MMKETNSSPDQSNVTLSSELNSEKLESNKTLIDSNIIWSNTNGEESNYSYVLLIEDKSDNRVVYLQDKLYQIGRCQDAQIIIKDHSVSRHHATIIKEYNQEENLFFYKIIDGELLGKKSKNGLTVNNRNYHSKYLEHGDLIRFSKNTNARFFVIDKNSVNHNLLADIHNQQQQEDKLEDYGKQTLTTDVYDCNDIYLQKDHVIEYISKLSSFAELSPYPIIEINLQGKLTYYNASAALLFPNLKKETMSHPLLLDLLKAEHKIQGNLFVREVDYQNKIFEQYIHYLPDLKLIRSYIFDFTKRKQIESKLKDSEAKYRAVVEQTSEGILLFNAHDLHIIEANLSATKILNYSLNEIKEKTIDFFLVDQEDEFKYKLKLLKQTEASFREELKFKVKYNQAIDVELSVSVIDYDNQLVFCSVFRDISRRKQLENELKYQAYHDSLTGLYKRHFFRNFCANALATSKLERVCVAIMFLDVDYFKQINDNYGHDIGDLLLKKFAQRLQNCLKKRDCLARWGGDEFVVLLSDIISRHQIVTIAQRIVKSMSNPFVCGSTTVQTSTSIGVAIFPEHGNDVDSLMKKADQALYITKGNGRNGYTLYKEEKED